MRQRKPYGTCETAMNNSQIFSCFTHEARSNYVGSDGALVSVVIVWSLVHPSKLMHTKWFSSSCGYHGVIAKCMFTRRIRDLKKLGGL